MARDVRPYFVPSPQLVDASPWLRSVDGDWERIGETIEKYFDGGFSGQHADRPI